MNETSRQGKPQWSRRTALSLVPLTAVALAGCSEQGVQVSDDEFNQVDEWSSSESLAINFSGILSKGSRTSSARYAGNVLVVNFWYAQCPPCRKEAPDLNDLHHLFSNEGVAFLGVNTNDNREEVQAFQRTFRVPFDSVVDQEDGASVQLAFASVRGPKATPTTLVIDSRSHVRARVSGLLNKSVLRTLIQDTLNH